LNHTDLQTTTYSMWNAFRNCRKSCQLRYELGLVPLAENRTLSFGSLIHKCLDAWYTTSDLEYVQRMIDETYPNRYANDDEKFDWHNAHAMMIGYTRAYPMSLELFKVIALEKVFTGPIVNPDTSAQSRTFKLSGKIDGLLQKMDGTYWLLENKTTQSLDGNYLEKLWCDLQITMYAYYLEQTLGIRITGIIYNVLVKASLKQRKEETEEEFAIRYAEACAKNKSGKSSATRHIAEPDNEFRARLIDKYCEDSTSMFHREEIYLSRDQYDELRSELWELTQQYLDAKRRGTWYKNTDFCFRWNRPCAYFSICRSGENPIVIENEYTYKEPHEELRESNGVITEGSTISAPPVF
jgi:hypothetical protein